VVIPSDSEPDAIRDVIADIAAGTSSVDKIKLSGDVETYGLGIPENTELTFELNGHELDPVPDENGDKVVYIGEGEWEAFSEYYERYVGVDQPIAWCEIPEFEE
jgi:hypothetical protein